MMWYILSLISALFRAIEFAFIKKLVKDINPYVLVMWLIFIEFIISLPFFFYFWIPDIQSDFRWATGVTALCVVISTILLSKALKETDISLAMPLTSFVPVLTYILWVFMLWETAWPQWVLWIIVILIGNYLLSASKLDHWYDALLAPFSSSSAKLMLFVCILWAIANPFGKIAIESSSTFFYVSVSYLYMSLFLVPIIAYQWIWISDITTTIQRKRKTILAWWLVRWLSRIAMLLAFSYTLVAYTISIKRVWILIAIVIGRLYFGEKDLSKRLLASSIMIIWVLLIIFET